MCLTWENLLFTYLAITMKRLAIPELKQDLANPLDDLNLKKSLKDKLENQLFLV
jgi:hypothetical protein